MKAAITKPVFWTLGQSQRTVEFAFPMTKSEPKPTILRMADYRPAQVAVAAAGKVRA